MKKTISVFLTLLLLLSFTVSAFAYGNQSRAVIAADLSEEEIAQVYQAKSGSIWTVMWIPH